MQSQPSLLDIPIPVITPDGKGTAIAWIDCGKNSLWIVSFPPKIGECWVYANTEIKIEGLIPSLPGRLGEAIQNTSKKIDQSITICPR